MSMEAGGVNGLGAGNVSGGDVVLMDGAEHVDVVSLAVPLSEANEPPVASSSRQVLIMLNPLYAVPLEDLSILVAIML